METAIDYDALRALADPLPIGLMVAGSAGDVLFHNARGAELLWLDAFELIQKGVSAFPDGIGLAAAWESLRGEDRSREQILACEKGRKLSITLAKGGFSMFGEACTLILIDDVTEQNQLEEFRDGFQKEVLHRLRGPLTSINTSLAFLSSDACGPLPEAVKEVVALGHAEAQRLHRLVDDVGHLLLLEGASPDGELFRENVDLGTCARKAVQRAERSAPARKRAFIQEIPPGAPTIVADYDKVGVILARLLSHAGAQAPAGSPIRVTVAEAEDGTGEVRVAYPGTGAPQAALRGAFSKFHRPADAGEPGDGDSGLGLYVARGFAELMGGSLELWAPDGGEVILVLRMPPAKAWGGFDREPGR